METIMRAIVAVAMLAAPAALAADAKPAKSTSKEFAPIKSTESVTYPLPPMPLPAVTAPADGKWAETEDSPALRVSRAWVKLGQAAGVERSEATRRLYQGWKQETSRSGPHSRAAQASYARFLAAYKQDLEQARGIYEGVLRDVESMDEGDGTVSNDGSPTGLAKDAVDQIQAADRDDRLTNSACFLSPDTCQQSDPTDKALQDEIQALVRDTLEAGGPDGGLSLYALKRKATLLALRAKVMGAVTQRAAARLATEVATQGDGQSGPGKLPSPVSNVASAQRRAMQAQDPYR
jgi:hypothetical protein